MTDNATRVISSHAMFCGPDGEWKPLGYIDRDSVFVSEVDTLNLAPEPIKLPTRVSMQITMEPLEGSHPAQIFFLIFPDVRYLVSSSVYRNPKMKPLLKNGGKP